jgi:hypothetical protein
MSDFNFISETAALAACCCTAFTIPLLALSAFPSASLIRLCCDRLLFSIAPFPVGCSTSNKFTERWTPACSRERETKHDKDTPLLAIVGCMDRSIAIGSKHAMLSRSGTCEALLQVTGSNRSRPGARFASMLALSPINTSALSQGILFQRRPYPW